jgi:mannitol/fructose-specific phosphotransferase system IIA component
LLKVLRSLATELITEAGIVIGATASSTEEAVAQCGKLLVELGAVSQEYADAMWEREQIFPSAIGAGFAIPHGTDQSRQYVIKDQLVFLQLAQPLAWGDEEVRCVLGIASKGDAHVELLGQLAELLQEPENLQLFYSSNSKEAILKLLASSAQL